MGLMPMLEAELASLCPLPCEDTRQPNTSQEVDPYQTPNLLRALILDFSASRTVRNKSVV